MKNPISESERLKYLEKFNLDLLEYLTKREDCIFGDIDQSYINLAILVTSLQKKGLITEDDLKANVEDVKAMFEEHQKLL